MKSMLKAAEQEFAIYEKTGERVILQQAGEKLWNVFGRYMEIRDKQRYDNHKDLKNASFSNEKLRSLCQDVEDLHDYFYNAEINIVDEKAVYLFKESIKKLKNRIKMLNLQVITIPQIWLNEKEQNHIIEAITAYINNVKLKEEDRIAYINIVVKMRVRRGR